MDVGLERNGKALRFRAQKNQHQVFKDEQKAQ